MRKSQRLRLWQRSGWTYRGLAAASGFDHQTLRRAMQGVTRFPSPEVCDVLARAVKVDVQELFPPRPTLERAA
jgi:transcriptional regulator with XRE-family HTH domain